MAVPAHDERDFEFAKKFKLPIIPVVQPTEEAALQTDLAAKLRAEGEKDIAGTVISAVQRCEICFIGDGIAINCGSFNGLSTAEFKTKITAWLAEKGLGKKAVIYKLRDWLFSRQRYWGEPFPICIPKTTRPLRCRNRTCRWDCPRWTTTSRPAPANRRWPRRPTGSMSHCRTAQRPDAKPTRCRNGPEAAGIICDTWTRTTNSRPFDPEKEKYWMPVDLYIGGAEHAVLHLLYSRFWHKLLYDLGYVTTPEPFKKLINQGMILGEDNQKMSKSRGNVINPDKVDRRVRRRFDAAVRDVHGPAGSDQALEHAGRRRRASFPRQVWRMVIDEKPGNCSETVQPIPTDEETQRLLHQTIKKVAEDIETFGFNTAISQMMIFVNHLSKLYDSAQGSGRVVGAGLAPFAPHLCEELWRRLGHPDSLAYEPWPAFDPARTRAQTVELVVQVLGKIKDRIVVDADADAAAIEAAALASEKVQAALAGKTVKKAIVVPGRLVNLVV